MIKRVFVLLIFIPALLRGIQYIGKGKWEYIGLDLTVGFPSMIHLNLLNLTIGGGASYKGKPGIGIGSSVLDIYFLRNKSFNGFFPIYFRVALPLKNLREGVYPIMLHLSTSFCFWGKGGVFSDSTSLTESDTLDVSWISVFAGIDRYLFELYLIGGEIGYFYINDKTIGESYSQLYIGLKLSKGAWLNREPRVIHPPFISIHSSISDDNGNGILQGRESGKLSITLKNNSSDSDALKGRLSITLLSPQYQNKITFIGFKKINKIPKNGEVHLEIPINTTTADIPDGELKFEIKYEGKSKWGDEVTAWDEVSIPTKPTTNLIKVAFIGFAPSHLPLYIIKVPAEKADYIVSYKGNEVHILNVRTGEMEIERVISELEAESRVMEYFEGHR